MEQAPQEPQMLTRGQKRRMEEEAQRSALIAIEEEKRAEEHLLAGLEALERQIAEKEATKVTPTWVQGKRPQGTTKSRASIPRSSIPDPGSEKRRMRFNVEQAAEYAASCDAYERDAFRRLAIISGVAEDTWKGYKARIETMRYFAGLLGEGPLDDNVFMAMLQAMDHQGLAPSTMDGYRSAYRFWQLLEGVPLTAAGDALVGVCNGLQYRCGAEPAQERGAITYGRLMQVLQTCRQEGQAHLCDPLEVCWLVAIRYSQLARMRLRDAEIGDGDIVTVLLRRDKRRNRKTMQKRRHVHAKRVASARLAEIMHEVHRANEEEGPMWPSFDVFEARKLIRVAAARYKWPTGLYYDGVHCLRHGGMQAADTVDRIVALYRDDMTQVTSRTRVNHYQKATPTEPFRRRVREAWGSESDEE